MTASRYAAVCPTDPAHGILRDWPTDRWAYHCSHHDHDGRPAHHPAGEAPRTRSFFTTDEVTAGRPTTAGFTAAPAERDAGSAAGRGNTAAAPTRRGRDATVPPPSSLALGRSEPEAPAAATGTRGPESTTALTLGLTGA